MLQQQNRLTKVRDFNLLMKYGRWVNGNFLDARILELGKIQVFPKKEDPEKFKNQLKLAFTVGLKVSKSAVKRNRAKRQLREAVRLLIKEDRLKIGYYILFVARPAILDKDYAEISQEVKVLLSRASVLINANAF
jgi:ribonuclease P protein component